MRDIIINPRKTYDLGSIYQKNANEIDSIIKNLTKISSKMKEDWTGDDSHDFVESFDAHIFELNNLINYLEGYSTVLEKTALFHNGTDNQFIKDVERSDLNEQHIN